MFSTYIFDLDGTLLDTLDDLYFSTNYALRSHGLPERTREEVRMFVGNGVRRLITRAVPGGERHPLFADVLATFQQYYLDHALDHTSPYPGVPEMLGELSRRGCMIAVVSNKFQTATESLCHRFFPDTVRVSIGENEAAGIRKKPAPDMVTEALQRLGVTAKDAVYVGDSDVDIDTARNAGLPCISVLWGFRDRPFLTAHGATAFVESPLDLAKGNIQS